MDALLRSMSPVLEFLAHRDRKLMRRIHRWPAPRWVRIWMLAATRGGDGWLWYAMGIVNLAFGGERRFRAIGAGAVSEGLGVLLFLRIKKLIGRRRPCAMEPHSGPRCCLLISFRSRPATRSPLSRWRCR